jgi:hypothetical protein
VGEFTVICDRPARFHFAHRHWPNQPGDEYSIVWAGFVKGTCEECWDMITLRSAVSSCGHFTIYPSSRQPNRDFILRPQSEVAKGEPRLQESHYCGPTAGPHYSVPSQR